MIESPLCLSLRVSTTKYKQHFCYSIIESIPIKLKKPYIISKLAPQTKALTSKNITYYLTIGVSTLES